MKRDSDGWICACGERLPLSKDTGLSADFQCPFCGERIIVGDEADPSFSASETQMINIQDMARMAQEGVDVGISGEWDTSDPLARKRDEEGEPEF